MKGNIVAESRASTGLQRPGLVGAVTQRFNLCAACIDYVKDLNQGLFGFMGKTQEGDPKPTVYVSIKCPTYLPALYQCDPGWRNYMTI